MALMLVASSCSDCTQCTESTTPVVDKQTSDSVSIYYGKLTGGYVLTDFTNFQSENKNAQMKKDILEGLKVVANNNSSEGTLIGMQLGVRMLQEIMQLESQGVEIDKTLVIRNFATAFMNDSVNEGQLRQLNQTLTELLEGVQTANKAAEEAKAAQAPEAQQNRLAGKAYVDKLIAEDPEIKVTESGLAYKVLKAGDNSVINDDTLVDVKYKGSLIDGTVFDQSPEGKAVTFSPSGVIPGFKEGLKLLGKGAKAILYIPGELAYGVNGMPQAGIGPNQTLIFEIEIVDLKK